MNNIIKDSKKTSLIEYWENKETISIIDKNLHTIEINAALSSLKSSDHIADIGCGDGTATVEYGKKVKSCIGFERSNNLRKSASAAVKDSELTNITIKEADILTMNSITEEFDAIITQRLLINLLTWKEQEQGLLNIWKMLKPGGRYIMIENTTDSFAALNDMRSEVGLSPIPLHWHNKFFDYEQLMNFMNKKFKLLKTHDLGLYYFLTRVYTQMFASFSGYGKNATKDSIFEQSDKAARVIFEKFGDDIKIGKSRVFGPIQVFVFHKEQ
jgi:ubiquinone/menaquinone biosynthesis C-methylase UbiE